MAIFKCDSCGYERKVPDALVGKKAKCPECRHGVTIVDEMTEKLEVPVEAVEKKKPSEKLDSSVDITVDADNFNLDETSLDVVFEDSEEVICAWCGHVSAKGDEDKCPECGASYDASSDSFEDIEDAVDVSDLAVEEPRQIWDEGVGDGEDGSELIREEEDPDKWRFFHGSTVSNVYAGVVSGVLALFFVFALSLLASSQAGMYEFLPFIIGTALTGVIVSSIFYSLMSRIPFGLVGPEAVLTAVLFLFIGSIYRGMAPNYDIEQILPTVLAAIALSSLCIGVSLWLLSRFKLGEFVRFIPLQIIGGVIGGVGVIILLGTFDWMGHMNLDWSNIVTVAVSFAQGFPTNDRLTSIAPSLAFGLLLFLAMCRTKNSLFLLAMIVSASGAGYAAGIWASSETLRVIATPVMFPDGPAMIHPMSVFKINMMFDNIQWAVIKANGLYLGALTVLSVLTVMYRATRLEIVRGRECNLDIEYKALGLTNMVTGLCGGMPASLSYSRSVGNYAAGGRGPLVGILTGLVCGAGLVYADLVLPFIPRFVPEGLLIYVGLDLIRDWLFRTRTAFTRRSDIWLLLLTFGATLLLGILEGIGFGVVLAIMVTVSRASKGGVVRNVLTGSTHSSNVDRAPAQQRTLKEVGDHIHILRVQGFLFLGSMEQLIKVVRKRLDDRNQLPVEYLILDFSLVLGFASAASIGFDKLANLVDEYGFELVIANAPLELEDHLEQMGLVGEEEGQFKAFFNLDYALEWCENRVLESESMLVMKEQTLPELLAPVFPEPKYIPALMKVLKRQVVAQGEAVFRQGDQSDTMYFVESGRLDVELEMESGKVLRLKKVGPGAVFGEMGIYTLATRSATIRAAEKCVLYSMTLEKLDAIEARAPMLVTAINRYLINLLSSRLVDSNAKVRDLML